MRALLFYTIFFGIGPLLMHTVGPWIGIPIGAITIGCSMQLLEPKRKKKQKPLFKNKNALGEYHGIKWINPKTGKALTKKQRNTFYAKI